MNISGRRKTYAGLLLIFLLGRTASFATSSGSASAAAPERADTAYVVAPYLNHEYGFKTVGTYLERVSNAPKNREHGTWGLISGSHNSDTEDTAHHASNIWFAQIGNDFYAHTAPDGSSQREGMIITLGNQTIDTKDNSLRLIGQALSTGNSSTSAFGLGGYYTTTAAGGGYLNATGQYTYYRDDFSSPLKTEQTGYGITLSTEAGQPFKLNANWTIEQQGQVIFQHLHLNPFNTLNTSVSIVDENSEQVRVGLRLAHQPEQQSSRITTFLHFDAINNLGDQSEIKVGNFEIEPALTRSWWQAGAGFAAALSKRVAFYSDLTYLRGFDTQTHGIQGQMGLDISFK